LAASCEPGSGYNLPPGCLEGDPRAPWNREEPRTCGECSHLLEGCCDYGICELEFEEAFDEEAAKNPLPAWEAACWARDWIVEHYKDMQEDTCDSFSSC
jgi:hypothetical protein